MCIRRLRLRQGADGPLHENAGFEELPQNRFGFGEYEMDWWEQDNFAGLEITVAPPQHFSSRGIWDRNRSHAQIEMIVFG
jgi:hypothetical protein